MFKCNNIPKLSNCGECSISVLDTSLGKHLNANDICRLCARLLWINGIDSDGSGNKILNGTRLTCNNDIIVTECIDNDNSNATTCSKLLQTWCNYNRELEGSLIYYSILGASKHLAGTSTVQALRTNYLKLEKYIASIHPCKGSCNDAVSYRESERGCLFNIQKIFQSNFCSADTLINIVGDILTIMYNDERNDVGLEVNNITISCGGCIGLDNAYVHVPKKSNNVRDVALYILTAWRIHNIFDLEECELIDNIIKECKSCKSLYQLCKIFFVK